MYHFQLVEMDINRVIIWLSTLLVRWCLIKSMSWSAVREIGKGQVPPLFTVPRLGLNEIWVCFFNAFLIIRCSKRLQLSVAVTKKVLFRCSLNKKRRWRIKPGLLHSWGARSATTSSLHYAVLRYLDVLLFKQLLWPTKNNYNFQRNDGF